MKNNKTAIKILFASLCAAAVFSGLWGFLTGNGAVPALVAAVILLVASQLLLLMMMDNKNDEPSRPEALDAINERLGNLEQKIGRLMQLRDVSLQNKPARQLPVQPRQTDRSTTRPPEAVIEPAPEVFNGPAYLDERKLSLYLEPVVDISSMATMFYRAELAFSSENSGRIRISEMVETIAKAGHSADIDMKLFSRLGPVIERLAQKGQLAGIICPMSQHSFSNQKFLEELTRYLKQYPELARVLIIEISQKNLAGLSQDGMAGLAFLAQIGATFCLGGAGLESPDLDSLASLGFRFLDLDYNDNISRYSLQAFATNGQAVRLAKAARKVDIKLIGSGLVRKTQCDALNHVITFGRGTMFSPPRLVRENFSRAPVSTNKAA